MAATWADEVLRDRGEAPCGCVRNLISKEIVDIDRRLEELRDLRQELVLLNKRADKTDGGSGRVCGLIEHVRQRVVSPADPASPMNHPALDLALGDPFGGLVTKQGPAGDRWRIGYGFADVAVGRSRRHGAQEPALGSAGRALFDLGLAPVGRGQKVLLGERRTKGGPPPVAWVAVQVLVIGRPGAPAPAGVLRTRAKAHRRLDIPLAGRFYRQTVSGG